MARRRTAGKPGFYETVFALWGLAVLLGSLGLTFGVGAPYLTAAAVSGGLSGVVAALAIVVRIVMRVRSLVRRLAKPIRRRRSRRALPVSRGRAGLRRGQARKLHRRAKRLIAQHADELARTRRSLSTLTPNGRIDDKRWRNAQTKFIDAVILEDLTDGEAKAVHGRKRLVASWRRKIDKASDRADRKRASAGVGLDFTPGMDGFEYEAFCAQVLARAGWSVSNKGDSADQGVDLIARRGGVTVAIQCKRYRSSIGNSAVQEIVAGKALVSRDAVPAVVSNAPYTRSAKELAAANGVHLLHHDQLPELWDLVGRGAGAALAA